MTVLQTIAVAFAMFSALPVPQFEWNEKNMRDAMCAFPLIGLVCGGLWCLCGVLPLPELARAAAFCLVPVAITGGIHLDGYADTSDALSSYGDREKKLEILKDSHCGAFAVIRLCCYFVAYFGLCGSVRFTPRAGLCWTLALVLERALSGFAVAAFPLAKDTGLAHTFATAADKQTVRRFLCGLSALLILALTALGGGGLAAAALLALWCYYFVAKKQFGGITGRSTAASAPLRGTSGAASSPMCRTPPPRLRPRSSSKRWPGSWRNMILSSPPRSAAVLSRWMLRSAPGGRPPDGWPACWQSAPTAWCRCSAASRRY